MFQLPLTRHVLCRGQARPNTVGSHTKGTIDRSALLTWWVDWSHVLKLAVFSLHCTFNRSALVPPPIESIRSKTFTIRIVDSAPSYPLFIVLPEEGTPRGHRVPRDCTVHMYGPEWLEPKRFACTWQWGWSNTQSDWHCQIQRSRLRIQQE